MKEGELTRRAVLRRLALVAAGTALVACKKEFHCTDESGLSKEDLDNRHRQEYADRSPVPGRFCNGCQQFQPPSGDGCGGCKVVKGPIHPQGYCKSWVAKPS